MLARVADHKSSHVIGAMGLKKYWFGAMAAIVMATQTGAQGDANSGQVFYPSCLAAADIVQGKHPAADSPDAAKQLNQAALCFAALTAIMNVKEYFKSEYAMCAPEGTKVAQYVPVVVAYLKNHPERLRENFHQLAVAALAAEWPCAK
jgi:hypothetical protein